MDPKSQREGGGGYNSPFKQRPALHHDPPPLEKFPARPFGQHMGNTVSWEKFIWGEGPLKSTFWNPPTPQKGSIDQIPRPGADTDRAH